MLSTFKIPRSLSARNNCVIERLPVLLGLLPTLLSAVILGTAAMLAIAPSIVTRQPPGHAATTLTAAASQGGAPRVVAVLVDSQTDSEALLELDPARFGPAPLSQYQVIVFDWSLGDGAAAVQALQELMQLAIPVDLVDLRTH